MTRKLFMITILSILLLATFSQSIGIQLNNPLLNEINDESNNMRIISGKAKYSDGQSTESAKVLIYRFGDNNFLTTNVNPEENWKVDCDWDPGTIFTVKIKGCCNHNGWVGKKEDITLLDSDVTYVGTITVYKGNIKPIFKLINLEKYFPIFQYIKYLLQI